MPNPQDFTIIKELRQLAELLERADTMPQMARRGQQRAAERTGAKGTKVTR